jgi:UPF0716 protein FxsA
MEMIEGLFLLISGIFLLLPGFITDALGFLMLIPPLRRWLALNAVKHFFIVPNVTDPSAQNTPGHDPTIEATTIEGEYRRIDK